MEAFAVRCSAAPVAGRLIYKRPMATGQLGYMKACGNSDCQYMRQLGGPDAFRSGSISECGIREHECSGQLQEVGTRSNSGFTRLMFEFQNRKEDN